MNRSRDLRPARRRRGSRRSGLSYIELVLASASAGALLLGLASVLYTANLAFDAGDTTAGRRIKSAEVLGDVMNDLRHAISFSNRTANSVTFKVPDRDGDGAPETITYAWSGTAGDPLLYSVNGGWAAPIATDVHNFNLSFVSQFMLAPQPPPVGGSRLLFVVENENDLTAYESARETLLDNWGYEITRISAVDPQADFDSELANNNVVFVSSDAADADLGTKLTDTTVGLVSENSDLTDELGFGVGSVYDVQDEIRILTNNHYITSDFAVNNTVTVLDFPQTMAMLDSPSSMDVSTLGETVKIATYTPSLVTLDPGDDLQSGGVANGRRAQLPWGAAALDDLTGESVSIIKRAVEWAAGAGANSPARNLLMLVADVENLTSQELQRKAMLEDWGYKPSLLAASDTQANIDAAVAEADVCYIHAAITEADLGTKLRHSAIGVVSESTELTDELGLRNGNADLQNDKKKVDVIEKRHYITQFFALGLVQVFTGNERMCKYGGNLGDAVELAYVEGSSTPSLAVMEPGNMMKGDYDEDPAPARRAFLPWGDPATFDVSRLTSDGREILKRSLEWAGGAEAVIPEVLLVVRDGTNLSGNEEDRQAKLEEFGYFVTPISDHATQAEFDTAIAAADVIYICDEIDALLLAAKVTNAPVGVVIEEPDSNSYLGLSDSFTSDSERLITIVDTSHYITELLTAGQVEIYTGDSDISYLDGSEADGIQTLASQITAGGNKSLIAIAAGEALVGGGVAAGRRVKLPWGDGTSFDKLDADALTIMERSVAWARGLGDDGAPDAAAVNLGYEDIFAAEETLIENRQVAMQVTLPEAGMFSSITGYFYDKDKQLRYAIYSDNNGEPGNLIAESEKFGPGGNGPQWTTLDLPPVQLPAGTYWIAFGIDNNNEKYYYESDAGQQVRYKNYDPVGNGFLTSWGTSDASHTRKVSIYGTYTPSN